MQRLLRGGAQTDYLGTPARPVALLKCPVTPNLVTLASDTCGLLSLDKRAQGLRDSQQEATQLNKADRLAT